MKKFAIIFALLFQSLLGFSQPGVIVYADPTGYTPVQLRHHSGLGIDLLNNKWVAFDSIGLGKFDTSWTIYNTSNSQIPSNKMTSLFVNNNDIYAGTEKGLGKFDGVSTWVRYDTTNGLLNNHINAINYKNGNLWVGTNKGVAKYNGSTWQYYYSINSSIANDTITSIEFGNNDTVWIGTINGLSCFYNNSFTNYDTSNSGLNSQYITCLKIDINNNLWIGTKSGGAYKMKNNIIKPLSDLYNIIASNNSISIWSIAINNNNEILIPGNVPPPAGGSNKQCVFKINPLDYTYVAYFMFYFFVGNYPYYFHSDTNSTIWYIGSPVSTATRLKSFNCTEGDMYDSFDFLSVNNIKARFNAGGQLFWDLEGEATFEVPNGSGKNTLFSGALWVGGKDPNDTLHVAAERYQMNGKDFFPGPVMDSAYYNQEQEKWNRLWKVKKSDIDYHLAHCWDGGYIPSQSLINWPGNGNTALGQASVLAPFKDWNNDGIYDPYAGDFPIIKGEESVFFMFNDDRKPHTESSGNNKLKIEVQAMAYGCSCIADTALWNTIFINYKIINRSALTYDSSFIGLFIDTDLGDATDDYIACDVGRGAFYVYNGDSIDGDYGEKPPIQAIVFLSGAKMDDDGIDNPAGSCDEGINGFNFGNGVTDDEHLGMSRFVYTNNTGGLNAITDPDIAADYYNVLSGIWKDGVHLQYWGNGHPSAGATGPECNFMFPGDTDPCFWGTSGINPGGTEPWTDPQAGNFPYDRRGMGSTGPFTFKPGDVQEIDIAFIYARDSSSSKSGSALDVLHHSIDSIRSYFNKDYTPCGTIISRIDENPTQNPQFSIYPNPASESITIDFSAYPNDDSFVEIFSIEGKLVKRFPIIQKKTEVRISELLSGVYIVKVSDNSGIAIRKLIIE